LIEQFNDAGLKLEDATKMMQNMSADQYLPT
jgi:hypothetical protein